MKTTKKQIFTKKRSSKVSEKRSSEPPRSPSLLDHIIDILKGTASQTLAVIVPSAAILIYNNVSNLLYYNETNLITTFIISVLFAISITWIEGHLKLPIQRVFKFVIYLGIAFTVIYIIAPYFIPPFEITEPENGDLVGMTYTVHGHGAIPGSSVKVYVLDDIGNKWLQDTVSTGQSGDWVCEKVTFGKDIYNDIGKKFTIYATTLNKNNEIYETPHLTVTRS